MKKHALICIALLFAALSGCGPAQPVPEAEAVVVAGVPGRIVSHISAVETALGKPIVSYNALWRKCLQHLGHGPATRGGKLLDLLS